ncbi:MAG: hypothetical protein WKG01_14070 [Kofleriaceae bacterium]
MLTLDGELALTVFTVDPDGPREVDAVRMRACAPWKFIAEPTLDCTGVDALELVHDNGRIVTSAAALAAAFPSPPDIPAPSDPWRAALAAGLEIRVPIIAEIDVGGQTLIARRDLEVIDGTVPRQNPRFTELRFDGLTTQTLRAGQRYRLTSAVDRTSLDERERRGELSLEVVDCNFYVTAGELDEPEVDIEDTEPAMPETQPNGYTAGASGSAWMFVVGTDDTGGMSVLSMPLTIE